MVSAADVGYCQGNIQSYRRKMQSYPTTKRKLQSHLTHFKRPQLWAVIGCIWLVVTIAGPFNTLQTMDLANRALYWAVVLLATYATGYFSEFFFGARIVESFRPIQLALVAVSLAISLPIFFVLFTLKWLWIDGWPSSFSQALPTFVATVLITFVIVVVRHIMDSTSDTLENKPAMILERLPEEKHGALISLSVQDHYVDIVTENGSEMVLMRLSDAIREASNVPGLQIHRSHWASLDQIAKVERKQNSARIIMTNGDELPVSRGYMPALREAGLLP